MIDLSDSSLNMVNFDRSISLPCPQGYKKRNCNPILECLVDQIKNISDEKTTSEAILEKVIMGLKNKQISWPADFKFISEIDWINMMREESNFYWFRAQNHEEMMEFENLLLFLCSSVLERKIILVPFLENDKEIIFGTFEHLQSIHVLFCQRLKSENFFVSIVRNT